MSKKILLIDDEEEMVEMVSADLAAAGYAMITALESLQGIEKAKAENPDVILLDIMMPEIDGYEICKKLKAMDETQNIPIIFFTAMGSADLEEKIVDAGGADYIRKPFEYQELLHKIEKALK